MQHARQVMQIGIDKPAAALQCPADHSGLHDDGCTVRCPSCHTVYRAHAGAPVTLVCDETGPDSSSRPADPAYPANFMEPTRVDWRLMLGMSHGQRVLEVGSGWGRLAFALAPWVGHYYSLERAGQRLNFQQVMLEQRGDTNVTLIGGSLRHLHFRPATLDWVIFNGVLDRLARAESEDPAIVHCDVLRQALQALQPGGHLLVTGRNRWSPNTLLRGAAGRSHRYGLGAYVDLLRQAGATGVRAYALLPHINRPRAIIPVEPPCQPAAQKYAIDQMWKRATLIGALARSAMNVLVDSGLMRQFYPYYMIVGGKPC